MTQAPKLRLCIMLPVQPIMSSGFVMAVGEDIVPLWRGQCEL